VSGQDEQKGMTRRTWGALALGTVLGAAAAHRLFKIAGNALPHVVIAPQTDFGRKNGFDVVLITDPDTNEMRKQLQVYSEVKLASHIHIYHDHVTITYVDGTTSEDLNVNIRDILRSDKDDRLDIIISTLPAKHSIQVEITTPEINDKVTVNGATFRESGRTLG
jgi:hypothetical protein